MALADFAIELLGLPKENGCGQLANTEKTKNKIVAWGIVLSY